METLKLRRIWNSIFSVLGENNPVKLEFKIERHEGLLGGSVSWVTDSKSQPSLELGIMGWNPALGCVRGVEPT